jgi:hypothetical protein
MLESPEEARKERYHEAKSPEDRPANRDAKGNDDREQALMSVVGCLLFILLEVGMTIDEVERYGDSQEINREDDQAHHGKLPFFSGWLRVQ